jgi:hypothetical protein
MLTRKKREGKTMYVITLNGKPVTYRNMSIILEWDISEYCPKSYLVAADAKTAKLTFLEWFPGDWKSRPKGIECRRLTKEDVV